MRVVKKLVKAIDEELCGAEDYAEKYLEYKVEGDPIYEKYRTMAEQELDHALILHGQVVEQIDKIRRIFNPPIDMQDKWNEIHQKYVDKTAHIKSMLEV